MLKCSSIVGYLLFFKVRCGLYHLYSIQAYKASFFLTVLSDLSLTFGFPVLTEDRMSSDMPTFWISVIILIGKIQLILILMMMIKYLALTKLYSILQVLFSGIMALNRALKMFSSSFV